MFRMLRVKPQVSSVHPALNFRFHSSHYLKRTLTPPTQGNFRKTASPPVWLEVGEYTFTKAVRPIAATVNFWT